MVAGCQSGGSDSRSAAREQRQKLEVDLKQAEAGDAVAQYAVGKYYCAARNGTGDLAQAVNWFQKAAKQKDPRAQTALATCYLHGRGVEMDLPAAIGWFEKAKAQGDMDALAYLVGLAFMEIPFVTNDFGNAGEELRRLASQGNAVAQGFAGFASAYGLHVPKDAAEAVKWFRKSAEQGQPASQAFLAYAYFQGQGVATNYAEAIHWSRKAAEQGDERGEEILGHCYQDGKGVKRNAVEAEKWFRRSAELGNEESCLALGLAYRGGHGVTRDYIAAYQWLDRAAARGNPRAISARAELAALMTRHQLAEADAPPRRHLTRFDRKIIDAHQQRYGMSCIPSSVEMVLKLLDRVPASYYQLQDAWKNKADGSFHDFDGRAIEGLTFKQEFTQAHGEHFPLADLYKAIDDELKAGRFVIIGLPAAGDTHDWVIYDEDEQGDFLAVSKAGGRTIENNHVRRTIAAMRGTDIGTYR
jgi:TPR repeat protein